MSPDHVGLLVTSVILANMAIAGGYGYFLGLRKGARSERE